ncbi:hypothetical protein AGMMS49531_08350 [Endomicrobiia bacterium]|nr:hypothetical protein AGMMS49531_08350 [Endomicrobiia bacterium]
MLQSIGMTCVHDAWLKAKGAWTEFKDESVRGLNRAKQYESSLDFKHFCDNSKTQCEKNDEVRSAERNVRLEEENVEFGKKKEAAAEDKVRHAKFRVEEAAKMKKN